jgi:hypothetical protein
LFNGGRSSSIEGDRVDKSGGKFMKHDMIDAIEISLLLLVLLLRFPSFPVAQRTRRTTGLLVIIKHLP